MQNEDKCVQGTDESDDKALLVAQLVSLNCSVQFKHLSQSTL